MPSSSTSWLWRDVMVCASSFASEALLLDDSLLYAGAAASKSNLDINVIVRRRMK